MSTTLADISMYEFDFLNNIKKTITKSPTEEDATTSMVILFYLRCIFLLLKRYMFNVGIQSKSPSNLHGLHSDGRFQYEVND